MSRNMKIETIKFLTLDEFGRLFKLISGKRDRAIFIIAYRHGLRASEIGLLQVDDLDFERQQIGDFCPSPRKGLIRIFT